MWKSNFTDLSQICWKNNTPTPPPAPGEKGPNLVTLGCSDVNSIDHGRNVIYDSEKMCGRA